MRSLRSLIAAGAALLVLLLAPSSGFAAPARDGWPATAAGEVGRRYVAAFGAGDAAMRAFYEREMTAEALAKKPASERLSNYRKLRERFGALTLGKVVKSKPAELTASLIDVDGKPHEFTFTLTAGTPARLATVTMKETRAGGHGGLGRFFHH